MYGLRKTYDERVKVNKIRAFQARDKSGVYFLYPEKVVCMTVYGKRTFKKKIMYGETCGELDISNLSAKHLSKTWKSIPVEEAVLCF